MSLLFALTAFASAFLLFWVEPLFARMVLPLLGGSPAVWNSCLMFFQAALLGGYLYAHTLTRFLRVREQAMVHMALLLLAFLLLPIAIPAGSEPPVNGHIVGWLLLLLATCVGAPFLLLSATAPLVQRWYAEQDLASNANPYVLYAASNAGSFCGLLAFPLLLEPSLRLGQQSMWWKVGYGMAVALVLACVVTMWRRGAWTNATRPNADHEREATPPTWRDRLKWVALAFVPSSLLLGVTTYLSTDVAAAPFLWVAPLALYLLTFVVAFARNGRTAPRVPAEVHALMVTALVLLFFWGSDIPVRWAYPIHLGTFFVTALVLHGELAASRPAPSRLTEYYLWLALGGALGGAFNALAAPLLFRSVAEYQLMVVLAVFLRSSRVTTDQRFIERVQTFAIILIPALLVGATEKLGAADRKVLGLSLVWIVSLCASFVALAIRRNSLHFGLSLTAVYVARLILVEPSEQPLLADRSFYGTYRVTESDGARFLYHGTTIHGAQFTDSARRLRPLTYYHRAGPIGQMFDALRDRLANRRIGIVGLGSGTLLCYGVPGQEWTFFEIDPLVESIARSPSYFTFLRDCPVKANVVIGDARLTLSHQPNGKFALLLLDAFSSDAIPVHLLTREALAMYRRLLEPGGVILVHISNRHLDLEPVVTALAGDAGLVGFIGEHSVEQAVQNAELDYECDWVLLAAREEDAGALRGDARWRRLVPEPGHRPWSDDYSNVFRAIKW